MLLYGGGPNFVSPGPGSLTPLPPSPALTTTNYPILKYMLHKSPLRNRGVLWIFETQIFFIFHMWRVSDVCIEWDAKLRERSKIITLFLLLRFIRVLNSIPKDFHRVALHSVWIWHYCSFPSSYYERTWAQIVDKTFARHRCYQGHVFRGIRPWIRSFGHKSMKITTKMRF